MKAFEHGNGLFVATLLGEPARSVGDDEGGEHEDDDEDALKGDRDSPHFAANKAAESKSIVDPVRHHDTNVQDGQIESNELSTRDSGRSFCLQDWDGTVDGAHSQAADNSTEDHDADGVRGSLDDGAGDHEKGAQKNGSTTTEKIADDKSRKRAEKAADFVERDNVTDCVGVWVVEGLVELAESHDSSHDAVVKTDEEEASGTAGGDDREQGLAAEADIDTEIVVADATRAVVVSRTHGEVCVVRVGKEVWRMDAGRMIMCVRGRGILYD